MYKEKVKPFFMVLRLYYLVTAFFMIVLGSVLSLLNQDLFKNDVPIKSLETIIILICLLGSILLFCFWAISISLPKYKQDLQTYFKYHSDKLMPYNNFKRRIKGTLKIIFFVITVSCLMILMINIILDIINGGKFLTFKSILKGLLMITDASKDGTIMDYINAFGCGALLLWILYFYSKKHTK